MVSNSSEFGSQYRCVPGKTSVCAVYSHINSLSNSATDACHEEGLKLTRRVSGGLAMRRIVLLLVDLSLIALATVCALVLRDNLAPSIARLHNLLPYLAASLVAALVVLPAFGLNRTIWRFSTLWDYLRISRGQHPYRAQCGRNRFCLQSA